MSFLFVQRVPIKGASFNWNSASIELIPQSQSLCGCDRQAKARTMLSAVCGSSGMSKGPEIVIIWLRVMIVENEKVSARPFAGRNQ